MYSLRKLGKEFTGKLIVLNKVPGHIVFNNDTVSSGKFEPCSESV